MLYLDYTLASIQEYDETYIANNIALSDYSLHIMFSRIT